MKTTSPIVIADQAAKQFNLTAYQEKIYHFLLQAEATHGRNRVFFSVGTIAERCNCSKNTVQRATSRLESLGLIEIKYRYTQKNGQTRQMTNLYRTPFSGGDVGKEQKNPVSIRKLWNSLVNQREKSPIDPRKFGAVAKRLGDSNAKQTLIDWLFYWKEKKPGQTFTERVWLMAFEGWIRNRSDYFVY